MLPLPSCHGGEFFEHECNAVLTQKEGTKGMRNNLQHNDEINNKILRPSRICFVKHITSHGLKSTPRFNNPPRSWSINSKTRNILPCNPSSSSTFINHFFGVFIICFRNNLNCRQSLLGVGRWDVSTTSEF